MTKTKRNKLLLVDGDNMLHRAYHQFGGFTSKGGAPSSMIFGLPYILRRMIVKFEPDTVLVCFDGGRHEKRLKTLPGYKDRDKRGDFDYESYVSQKEDVMELLCHLGCYVAHQVGQEADDLIYIATRKYSDHDIVIVSSDKDFHQLISDTVSIYSPAKESVLTPSSLRRHVDYSPEQCVEYLILDGDKSDKIPGYPGMGEKRIKAFFLMYGSIKNYMAQDTRGFMERPKLKEVYKRNKLLIDLKYFWRKHNRKQQLPIKVDPPLFNAIKVAIIARKYNSTTLTKVDFIKTFKNIGKYEKE